MNRLTPCLLLVVLFLLAGQRALAQDEFVTPYDFGAVGNGIADDTSALRSAVNTGKRVHLAGGTFRMTSTITVPSNGGIVGPGKIRHDWEASSPPSPPSSADIAFHSIGTTNLLFSNFAIEKTFVDGSYAQGFVLSNGNGYVFDGVEIARYSARYGIHIIEARDFTISNCVIRDFMVNSTTDMIQDSPAGLRVTRSRDGVISGNRIQRIEVGPAGLVSISPIIPSYGPQGYQSDGMTIMQSRGITVSDNLVTTTGEAIDMLLSNSCTVSNNIIKEIHNEGVKMLGVRYTTLTGNHFTNCYTGMALTYHPTDVEASGNVITANVFQNMGTPNTRGNTGGNFGVDLPDGENTRHNIVAGNLAIDTQANKTTDGVVRDNGQDNLVSDNRFVTAITDP